MLGLIFVCVFVLPAHSWVKEMENPNLWQGDIVLDPDERVTNETHTYASVSIVGGRWPNGVVPYVIGSDIGPKGVTAIHGAFDQYHRYTCIKFKPRTNERAHLHFFKGGGCSSPVGYRSGRVNRISLDTGCWHAPVAMHEIGHSLGLHHEQCSPERDSHVTIKWENIADGLAYNFDRQKPGTVDAMGDPYDLDSMMHYGSSAFSKNGKRTIETKKCLDRLRIGQRRGFSDIDVKHLIKMYPGCTPKQTYHMPKKACVDTIDYCDHMIKQGYCGVPNREHWMFTVCCKSCTKAGSGCGGAGGSGGMPSGGGGGGEGCKDETKLCEGWAARGDCNNAFRKWMRKHCCKSCKGR